MALQHSLPRTCAAAAADDRSTTVKDLGADRARARGGIRCLFHVVVILRMGFRHDGALRGRRKTLAVFCAATAAALAIVVCSGSSAIAGVSAPAVAAQSPVCTENHLVITFSATSSATGHEGDVVRFINLGPDCTLRGYPGVDGLSAPRTSARSCPSDATRISGRTAPWATRVETVNLATGGTAWALLEGLGRRLYILARAPATAMCE